MSDIHIGNGASYSWFQGPYVTYATTMFNRVAADPSVAELCCSATYSTTGFTR